MRPENQRMQDFLAGHGIQAIPKYLKDGSQKGAWRLYGLDGKNPDGSPIYQKWWDNFELQGKLIALGFTDYDGTSLDNLSGNGGLFSIFVRGHNELLEEPIGNVASVPYTSRATRRDIRMARAARANDRITKRNGAPMYY